MALLQTPHGPISYRLDGPDAAPVLVLSHSLGLDLGMWDAQAADLSPSLRVLRLDTRGHGASAVTPGDYTIAELAGDVLTIVDALGIDRFAFCGASLGGMIGQWLGAHHGARLTQLILANTTPRVSDPASMETRRLTVLGGGMPAVVDAALSRFFTPATLASNGPVVASARRVLLATDPVGYAGCCAAIRDMDQRTTMSQISTPTLVIGGAFDVSMPWDEHSRVLVDGIAGARALELPTAHLSSLERSRTFTAAIANLVHPPMPDTRAAGMAVRRAVLGDAHVDRAVASTTDLTRGFQDLITQYAWGTIWTRPGLNHRTRRLLVLAITASLGRWEEFRLHLRTGFARELEACDVEEVLLHVAIYAGVPAANTAFHMALDEQKAIAASDR